MRRSTTAALAFAVFGGLALSGCTASRAPVPGLSSEPGVTLSSMQGHPAVTLPSGRQLVALTRYEGGFVTPGWSLIQPPKIAVYADGLAVADASRTLTLSRG